MDIEEVIIKTEPTEIEGNVEEVEDVEITVVNTVAPVAATARKVPTYALVYVCNICNKVFGDKSLYEHHVTIVHRPLTVNILSGAFCDKCKKILDENVYDAHLPLCLTNYSCLPMTTGTTYQRYNKKFECFICNKAMINLNRLSEHLRTVHRPITINYVDKSTHSFCDTCKNLFKDDLFTHFPCNAVDVKCFFCLTKMPLKNHFLTHNLFSQGFRKFQCGICTLDTKLMNFTELNEHMKHHNKLGIFQCVKCKLHMNQSDLERHYELYHQGCKCVTDPCTCDKYNEYFYIKNILKIDIPFENVKPTTDTQNKSIQTCTTFEIPNMTISCKNCGPSKLPENTSSAKKENKSKISYKNCGPLELPENTSGAKEKNKAKKSSTTPEKQISTIEWDDKLVPTVEELLQKDKIDKESFLRFYFSTYSKNNYWKPLTLQPEKRLTRHQLKIYRGLIMKQAQMKTSEKYNMKIKHAQLKLSENAKTANNEQHSTVVKEQDEIMCIDIVKEEQTEFIDSGNLKIELDHLLQDSPTQNSQQPVNVQETSVPPMPSSISEESQNEENGNTDLEIQSNIQNIEFQTVNNSVNTTSFELKNEQLDDSTDSSDANSFANVDQQDDVNSEANEEMYKVHLVNIDCDKNEVTGKDISTKTSANFSESIQNTSQHQAFPKTDLFQDLDDINGEHSSDNLDPDYLPNFKTNPAEYNDWEICQACSICGLMFKDMNSLKVHLMQTHRLRAAFAKRYMTKTVYCEFCKICTTQNHFYQCTGVAVKDTCFFCNMNLPKRDHFELHNIEFITYNKMLCTLCNDKTEYKIKSLNEHRIKDHKHVGVFECVICKDKFSSNIKLKKHLVFSNHKFDVKNSAKNYRLLRNHCEALKFFKCKVCEGIFFTHHNLNNHRCNKLDLCFICGQTFTRSTYLKEHLNTHLKTQSYNCKICDKKFVSRKHMIQHQKIHEKKKKFNCLECPQTFAQQTSLIYHMATHTKENVFKCSVCDILFDKQSKLTAHMQIHNENGTNPHKCEVCNKFFSHKCNLLVHKRTHRENNTA